MPNDQQIVLKGWQPFTWGGVAALAQASFWRLSSVIILWALPVCLCLTFALYLAVIPALDTCIRKAPKTLGLEGGRLTWSMQDEEILSETWFISVALRSDSAAPFEPTGSDFQFEFFPEGIRIHSHFGYLPVPYPDGIRFHLMKSSFIAWWGAWKPLLPGLIPVGWCLALILCWNAFACVHGLLFLLLFRPFGAGCGWKTTRRVCLMSMIPGAWVMSAGIIAFVLGFFNFYGLLAIFTVHLMIPILYIVGALIVVNRNGPDLSNPFKKKL